MPESVTFLFASRLGMIPTSMLSVRENLGSIMLVAYKTGMEASVLSVPHLSVLGVTQEQ